MHRLGITHGDLKPENIIITETGQAKTIDLAQSGHTKSYTAPEFPEIFETKVQWRSSIDIYSFWSCLLGPVFRKHGQPPTTRFRTCVADGELYSEMCCNQPHRAPICSEYLGESLLW